MATVEIIGLIAGHEHQSSEPYVSTPEFLNPAYVRRIAQVHEAAGFDRALIGWVSSYPDGLQIATHAAAATSRLKFLVAHRPGFQAPTNAARAFATFDRFYPGRAAIHVISGGDDVEQQRDGDYLGHGERYARTDEYVEILKKIWNSNNAPVDHEGRYYRFKGALFNIEPEYRPRFPIYFGGASEAALRVAARHADVYALFGEDHAGVADQIARVRAAAAAHGRRPRFSISFRPIVADTEQEAWDRAHALLDRTIARRRERGLSDPAEPQAVGSRRLLATAAKGEVLDKRLFTALARVTGAGGNITALVGTAEQVSDALLDYYRLGADAFILRGFDSAGDAEIYGAGLIPLLREKVAAESPRALSA
ncbi:LLM class flavin-dependent oxidoreductase [Zavarzinia compransoris]|uniref:Alkanesulfonate monooxygenase n=1 Tax=Zavarzinia compransoris TaxID=1264899 RepID=A0A317DU91_9PROT|nr:LLM class flavin-dependent oxidoreductase [Zavarzinia compransoris]PWR18258.1 alkanesulfonate monooxygenase [Zavarzinia compransoris]TDP43686.1 alkanesulfonate monooxygenase [Zavarzinia compransoris]